MSSASKKGDLFSFDERLGIYFSVQSACLSAAAVTALLAYALVRWLGRLRILLRDTTRVQTDLTDSSLFLNLMLADLLQAIGNMPSIRWMRQGFVEEGSLCTAQAVIKQIGINGVAWTSLIIALHTFLILILRWRAPRHIAKYLVLGVWAVTALVVGIPYAVNRNLPYYGDTGYWCWIGPSFRTEQIVSEYLWVWTAAIFMTALYGVMFMIMRGYVVFENGVHWRSSTQRVKLHLDAGDDEEEKETRAIAYLLLFYPAVYIVCVLPTTVSRWLYFSGHTVPDPAILFSSALFAFSGLFNVVLFLVTRPELVKGPESPTSPTTAGSPISPNTHSNYGHLPQGAEASLSPAELEKQASGISSSNAGGSTEKGHIHESYSYQSPQTQRALSLATSGGRGHSTDASYYSPPSTARPRTGGSRQEDDDDDEGYGRLPV